MIDKFLPLLRKYINEFWADGKNVEDMGRVVNEFHTNRICGLMRNHGGQVVVGSANGFNEGTVSPIVVLNP